jgi:hypothetical protein
MYIMQANATNLSIYAAAYTEGVKKIGYQVVTIQANSRNH